MITTRNFVPLLLAGCTGMWLALQTSLIDAYPAGWRHSGWCRKARNQEGNARLASCCR